MTRILTAALLALTLAGAGAGVLSLTTQPAYSQSKGGKGCSDSGC